MRALNQIAIGTRLWISHGLLLVLLIAIGAYGAGVAARLAGDMERTAQVNLVRIAQAQQLEGQVQLIARAARDLLLLDAANQIKKQNTAIDQAQTDSEKALADLQAAAADSAEQALLTELRERATRFFAAVAKFRSVQKDGAPEDARESLIVGHLRPAQASYQESLKSLVELQMSSTRKLAQDDSELARRAVTLSMLLVLAAVVLGVLAARAIAGSILSPVQHARQAAEAIGHGDLRHDIQVQGQDEVAHMLRAMQDMQAALSRVVASVSDAAGEVRANA